MRIVKVGIEHNATVAAMDNPGVGGSCHEYSIHRANKDEVVPMNEFATIHFQNGPIKENGINGCQQEDLLTVVIDRLRSFQSGPFACRENALALTKCEEALHWLNHRTTDRINRGVEGINKQ